MSARDLISRALSEREFAAVVEALPGILIEIVGEAIVVCQYGALSKLHPNLWYVPMDVGLKWLDRFLRESAEQRIFEPGGSDLHIATRDGSLEVRLCHEYDLHLSGTNPDLVRRFAGHPVVAPLFAIKDT